MFLFGGGKKKEPEKKKPEKSLGEEASDAIKGIRGNIEVLEKRRRYLDVQLNELDAQVRERIKQKDKTGAKNMLIRKQAMSKNATQIDNQIITLENQCLSLESSTTNMTAVNAMELGLKTQKRITKEMNADRVDEVFDQLHEQQDLSNEVSDLFAQNVATLTDDLDEELESMEALLLEEAMLEKAKPVPQSSEPVQKTSAQTSATPAVTKNQDQEAAELAALQTALGM